jgi:hypothetical protein
LGINIPASLHVGCTSRTSTPLCEGCIFIAARSAGDSIV